MSVWNNAGCNDQYDSWSRIVRGLPQSIDGSFNRGPELHFGSGLCPWCLWKCQRRLECAAWFCCQCCQKSKHGARKDSHWSCPLWEPSNKITRLYQVWWNPLQWSSHFGGDSEDTQTAADGADIHQQGSQACQWRNFSATIWNEARRDKGILFGQTVFVSMELDQVTTKTTVLWNGPELPSHCPAHYRLACWWNSFPTGLKCTITTATMEKTHFKNLSQFSWTIAEKPSLEETCCEDSSFSYDVLYNLHSQVSSESFSTIIKPSRCAQFCQYLLRIWTIYKRKWVWQRHVSSHPFHRSVVFVVCGLGLMEIAC